MEESRRMFSEDYVFPYEEGYEAFFLQEMSEEDNPYDIDTQTKENGEWLSGYKEAEQDSIIEY